MTSAPGRTTSGAAAASGFTLIELVLVLAVLMTLAGVTVLNLRGFGSAHELDESANRLTTALRLARAEAANQGRRIRIQPDGDTGLLRVLWEPEPLARPGEFSEYPSVWRGYLPAEPVRVVRSRLTGESRYRSLWSERAWSDGSDAELEPVTFYPDGTSDSAVLELQRGELVVVVEISGHTGTVSTYRSSPDQRQGAW